MLTRLCNVPLCAKGLAILTVQGDPSGLRQHLVDFDFVVPLPARFGLGSRKSGRIGMSYGQHGGTLKSKLTKYSRRPDGSPCIKARALCGLILSSKNPHSNRGSQNHFTHVVNRTADGYFSNKVFVQHEWSPRGPWTRDCIYSTEKKRPIFVAINNIRIGAKFKLTAFFFELQTR